MSIVKDSRGVTASKPDARFVSAMVASLLASSAGAATAQPSAAVSTAPSPAPATASDQEDVWARRFAFDLQAGLGAPYGLLGASFEWTPVRFFTLAMGAGGNVAGPQLAVLPRVRLVLDQMAVALGAGPSWGPYQSSDGFLDPSWVGTYDGLWLNGDISVEERWSFGLELRMYLGVATVAYAESVQCDKLASLSCPAAESQIGKTLPYLGLAIGYAFGRTH